MRQSVLRKLSGGGIQRSRLLKLGVKSTPIMTLELLVERFHPVEIAIFDSNHEYYAEWAEKLA